MPSTVEKTLPALLGVALNDAIDIDAYATLRKLSVPSERVVQRSSACFREVLVPELAFLLVSRFLSGEARSHRPHVLRRRRSMESMEELLL